MATPLLYFSYGMTRAGSTLGFELVRTALEYCGYSQPLLTSSALVAGRRINMAQHISPEQAEELLEEVRNIGHPVVIKTHTRPDDPAVVGLMQRGQAIAHAVYRDPRDMALSMVNAGERARAAGVPGFAEIHTLDDAFDNIRHQTNSLTAWLRLPGVLPLYYDDLAFDTEATARRILHQLGLQADAAFIARHVLTNRFTQKYKGQRQRFTDEMDPGLAKLIAQEFTPLFLDFIIHRADLPDDGSITLPAPRHLRTTAQN